MINILPYILLLHHAILVTSCNETVLIQAADLGTIMSCSLIVLSTAASDKLDHF
jgi:hypothetical protein